MDTESTHILAEFWDCKEDLNDQCLIRDHMLRATHEANADPLNVFSKSFEPQGVSVLIAVSESHLSIHTWPEKGYAAVDVFTCGKTTEPVKAIEYLREALRPRRLDIAKLNRGRKRGIGMTSFSKSGTCCRLG